MDRTITITRGLDYAAALGKLAAADPHAVADCKWREDKANARDQRARNMHKLGLN